MRLIITSFLFSLMATAALRAQGDDAVLMRMGGREVMRSEFEYAYNKNQAWNKMLLAEFVQAFIQLKLESMEAEALRLDTLPEVRVAWTEWQRRLQPSRRRRTVVVYHDKAVAPQRLLHLFIYLPQNSSGADERRAVARMDSVYKAVQEGASFEECVERCSEAHPGGLYGEELSLDADHTMSRIERQLNSLESGELSRPFVTPAGVHLIQSLGRDEEAAEEEAADTTAVNEHHRYLLAELHEALLRDALKQREGEQRPRAEELEAYFKKHRKRYAWEFPHYKGAVLMCKDKSSAKALKKLLKRTPFGEWPQTIADYNAKHPEAGVESRYGLFQIGKDAAVDKVVFRQGDFQPSVHRPYVTAVGKRLKRGPESYADVGEQVTADYLSTREKEKVAALLKKYKVEIDQEVLKTVNNHGD